MLLVSPIFKTDCVVLIENNFTLISETSYYIAIVSLPMKTLISLTSHYNVLVSQNRSEHRLLKNKRFLKRIMLFRIIRHCLLYGQKIVTYKIRQNEKYIGSLTCVPRSMPILSRGYHHDTNKQGQPNLHFTPNTLFPEAWPNEALKRLYAMRTICNSFKYSSTGAKKAGVPLSYSIEGNEWRMT